MNSVIEKVAKGVIDASTKYTDEHKQALRDYMVKERCSHAKWMIEKILENAEIAEKEKKPLCDDTGIPQLILEVGKNRQITGRILEDIQNGIAEGLRMLPGRPMAVLGNDIERVEQTAGLSEDSGQLKPAPMIIKYIDGDLIKLHILLQGGGPEIRGKTFRIFHKRSIDTVLEEVLTWAKEGAALLGCTPCVPFIGIGRTHSEATSLMLEAMVKSDFSVQNEYEKMFTNKLNETNIGPLGIGGDTTAIATFINIGNQRASGVRIVSLRLNCIVEPRRATVLL